MHQLPFLGAEPSAHHCNVPSGWSMSEKLSNQCIPTRFSFRKEQNPGRKTIDAVHHKGSLSLPFQFRGKKRPGGGSIGAFHGHSRKPGRLIERHHGIVFVKHRELA